MKVTFDFGIDQVTAEVYEIPRVYDEVELEYDIVEGGIRKSLTLEVYKIVHSVEKVQDGYVAHHVTVKAKLI